MDPYQLLFSQIPFEAAQDSQVTQTRHTSLQSHHDLNQVSSVNHADLAIINAWADQLSTSNGLMLPDGNQWDTLQGALQPPESATYPVGLGGFLPDAAPSSSHAVLNGYFHQAFAQAPPITGPICTAGYRQGTSAFSPILIPADVPRESPAGAPFGSVQGVNAPTSVANFSFDGPAGVGTTCRTRIPDGFTHNLPHSGAHYVSLSHTPALPSSTRAGLSQNNSSLGSHLLSASLDDRVNASPISGNSGADKDHWADDKARAKLLLKAPRNSLYLAGYYDTKTNKIPSEESVFAAQLKKLGESDKFAIEVQPKKSHTALIKDFQFTVEITGLPWQAKAEPYFYNWVTFEIKIVNPVEQPPRRARGPKSHKGVPRDGQENADQFQEAWELEQATALWQEVAVSEYEPLEGEINARLRKPNLGQGDRAGRPFIYSQRSPTSKTAVRASTANGSPPLRSAGQSGDGERPQSTPSLAPQERCSPRSKKPRLEETEVDPPPLGKMATMDLIFKNKSQKCFKEWRQGARFRLRANLGPASDSVTAYSAWCNVLPETIESELTPVINAGPTDPTTSPETVKRTQANLRGDAAVFPNPLDRGNLVPSEFNEDHQDTDSDDDMQSVVAASDEPMTSWLALHDCQQMFENGLPGGMLRMTGQRRFIRSSEEFWAGVPQVKIVSDDFSRLRACDKITIINKVQDMIFDLTTKEQNVSWNVVFQKHNALIELAQTERHREQTRNDRSSEAASASDSAASFGWKQIFAGWSRFKLHDDEKKNLQTVLQRYN